jgi:outer membrane lipoprotein-sorting protein
MKTKVLLLIIVLIGLLIPDTKGQSRLDAKKILSKTDQINLAVKDKSANIKMVMVRLKNGKEKIKKAVIFQKGADRKLFCYVYPKADSGIAFLSLPNHQIYIYLSLFKKAKKITNIAQRDYNNSDFSFQDMSSQSFSANFIPELLRRNDTAYIIKLIPKKHNIKYDHALAMINRQYFYPEQISYFNRKEDMIKQATYHFIKLKGIWVAKEVDMTDFDKNHMTRIIMSDIKINTGLRDEMFTVENLGNIKANNDLIEK